MAIRLVLADDHPVVLAGLEQLLALEDDFAIVAKCTNGDQALRAVRGHRPDVLVLDLQMPGNDGLAVLGELAEARLPTRVVILTATLDEDDVLEAVRLGVRGLILKDMAPRLLVECIRAVAAGREWLDQGSLSQALNRLMRREAGVQEAAGLLTPRELAVVHLVAKGLRNKEIARQLAITEGTVKIHLHNVYQKVGVDSRIGLTLWAQQRNIA
jgi:DNA-binding NarL/FixJ family response regulator